MKKIAILMVLAMVLSIGAAYAAAPGDASGTVLTDFGTYTATNADTVDVLGGNIYNADVDSTVSTARWAGLYGNVSGSLVLGDSVGTTPTNIMYTWSGATGLVVYAVNGTVDWSSVDSATNATVTAEYAYLADAVAPNDNFRATFTGTHALNSNLFSTSTNPFSISTEDGSNGPYWNTMALQDAAGKTVWAAEVVDAGHTAYDNVHTVQFQMIVPDSSAAEDTNPTTYDMWLELE